MSVSRGVWDDECGYLYTCGRCHDLKAAVAKSDSLNCPDCYGGDWDKLVEAFAVARGERYYALLKAMLRIRGKAWVDAFRMRRQQEGKITPSMLVELFLDTGLPRNRFKPYMEWLEERECLRLGMYELFQDQGFKIGKAIKQVEAKRETL